MKLTRSRTRAALLATLLSSVLASPAAFGADTTPPRIEHTRLEKTPVGQAAKVRATITDESEIFAPTLYVRAVGHEDFVSIEMTKKKGGVYEAKIPAEQMSADVEYFIEAFDEHGNGPAREGSPEAPIALAVFDPSLVPPTLGDPLMVQTEDEDDEPLVGQWWFWALIGVAVAGGVTTAILLASGGGGSDVSVVVRGPDPSGVLK